MNDKDHYCYSCNREVYAHGLNAYGECGPCEQWRNDEPDPWANEQVDPWAELTPENEALRKANEKFWTSDKTPDDYHALREAQALINPDEPSAEDYEYLYKSLGIPNPNN